MKRYSFLVALLIVAVASLKAKAQINPDRTLGPDRSRPTPVADRTVIEGGAKRGRNLFHSFRDFNVGEGQSVYFNNPDGVERIFSRVTGNNRSNILGTLGVLGNADLILVNPNGILLGPNARLDVRGSFLATTADRILFDNYSFSATNPAPPLLTIHTPIGLQMGQRPGPIRIEGNTTNRTPFSVPNGETFSFLGGNIALTNTQIDAPSGRIEMGSLRSGKVDFTETPVGFRLGYPVLPIDRTFQGGNIGLDNARLFIAERAGVVGSVFDRGIYFLGNNIRLHNQTDIEINSDSSKHGGPIRIDANRLRLSLGGKLEATTPLQGVGGDIIVNASDQVTLIGNNPVEPLRISNILTAADTAGRAGEIRIQTGRLQLRQGAEILSLSSRAGRGGDVIIRASESITANGIAATRPYGGSIIGSIADGSGRGGNVHIIAPRLVLQGGNRVQTTTTSSGRGGNITIEVTDAIIAEGFNPRLPFLPSGIVALPLNNGDGGNIRIRTGRMALSRGANVTASVGNNYGILASIVNGNFDPNTAGTGNAGNVNVQADSILIQGGNPRLPDNPTHLSSFTFGEGDAGNVNVSTRQLTIRDGGALTSSSLLSLSVLGNPLPTSGRGNGGNLTVNADYILLDGFNTPLGLGSFLGTISGGFGNGGNTQIRTDSLTVRNGGTVNSGAFAIGNAGRLDIAADSIQVEGVHSSGQRSVIGTFADRPDPALREAFVLPARPTGDTGELMIQSDRLNVQNGGLVSVRHQGSGNAGRMRLQVNQLRLDRGTLSAETALGEGGNITVQSNTSLLRRNSQITATVLGGEGNGGNLSLESGLLGTLPNENSDLIANSVGGNGGEINLNTSFISGFASGDRLTPQSDITASSELGIDGTIRIFSPNIDTNQLATELPEVPLDSSDQIVVGCPSSEGANFVTTGRGGLPATPAEVINRAFVWQDDREPIVNTDRSSISLPMTDDAPVEVQGWRRNPQGQVELVATIPQNRSHPLPADCMANFSLDHDQNPE